MFKLTSKGDFKNLERFLKKMDKDDLLKVVTSLAQEGVNALSSGSPKETGALASAWSYEILQDRHGWTITWTNSAQAGGNLAIMLQYGHGTGTGGWVQGWDYINPAMRPVMDRISTEIWKVVTSA